MSLYEKYGGFSAVSTMVHQFYEKIKEERQLDRYFAGVEMEKLINHQVHFLSKVLGGPNNYTGRTLAAAHKHLNITSSHFDLVGTLLSDTLKENRVEEEDIATVMGVIASVKGDIVASKTA